jgi:oxygen-dependent protoporphyrinogen oxidase
MPRNIAIIGGGVAGLTAAYYLKKSGHIPTLLESSPNIGGVMQTEVIDGFTIENGPNTILLSDQRTLDMLDDLVIEIEDASPKSQNRYVVKNKKCVPVPTSLGSFIKSSLFSSNTKFKIFTEAFRRNSPTAGEESISQFVVRRFNKEVLDFAVNPFIAGTYAGDPDSLSIEHSFPLLIDTEREHGSIIGGFFKNRKLKNLNNIKRRTVSFKHGISALPKKLAEFSINNILYQSQITDISKSDNGYKLNFLQNEDKQSFICDEIICTVPTYALNKITLNGEKYSDFDELSQINYPPVISISLGYKTEDIPHPLDGFGALVPKCEQMNILGVLFSSTLFANRAPDGHSLLTIFMGGSRQPKLSALTESQRLDLIRADLQVLLDIHAEPVLVHQTEWEKSIPQYHVGYGHYKSIMNMVEAKLPYFHFAGNYVNGISIQDTILNSMDLVNEINRQP